MDNSADEIRQEADALLEANRLDEAIAAYRQATKLRPDDVAALNNLSFVLLGTGRVDEAIEASRQAIALRPDLPLPYQNLADALKQAGRVDEALEYYERAPKSAHLESERLFTLHLKADIEPQKLLEEHRAWDRTYAHPLRRFIKPHENDRNPQRQLRIGYVAYHLGNHPLGRFLLPLIENHDRSGFEVFCYCDSKSDDHIAEHLTTHTDVWRTTKGMSDEQLAEQVREDRIDILVDLMMHAVQHRLLAFARKPAPVQVTYLAYPGTTGMGAMDYRLTDPYLDPLPIADCRLPNEEIGNRQSAIGNLGMAEISSYSETSVWLPHTFWCYPPPPEAPAVRPPPVLKAGHIAFGCFNSFIKITPEVLTAWCELLNRVAGSTLALTCPDGSARQLVLDRVQQAGIQTERITLVRNAPMPIYFSMYHHIDIALNPFPYPGATTTCDALWMGVPAVTLAGQTAVSRAGLSVLANIGLTELVANSPHLYLEIARKLAADVPRLTELRTTMRQHMQSSPLMNAAQFTRDVEAAFRLIWKRWCEN